MSAPAVQPATVSLRDLLAGWVYYQAEHVFAKALDPFVKLHMRHAHPVDPKNPTDAAHCNAVAGRDLLTSKENDIRDAQLPAALAALTDAEGKGGSATGMGKLRKAVDTLNATLKRLERDTKKLEGSMPQPRWVLACHTPLGSSMRPFARADGKQWDLYTLVVILKAYLPTVFAPAIGLADGTLATESEAKALLEGLLKTMTGRTRRAHQENEAGSIAGAGHPTEAEVVDALGHMARVLQLCSTSTDSAAELDGLRAEAQRLVEAARAGAAGTTELVEMPKVSCVLLTCTPAAVEPLACACCPAIHPLALVLNGHRRPRQWAKTLSHGPLGFKKTPGHLDLVPLFYVSAVGGADRRGGAAGGVVIYRMRLGCCSCTVRCGTLSGGSPQRPGRSRSRAAPSDSANVSMRRGTRAGLITSKRRQRRRC